MHQFREGDRAPGLRRRRALSLADRAGVTIHEDASGGADRRRRTELLDAMERAVTWYHERLLSGPDAGPARNYLRSRATTPRWSGSSGSGGRPTNGTRWQRARALRARADRHRPRFVNRRGRRQDSFRSRIVFPICDPSGRPVAFGGRILPTPPGAPPLDRPEPKYKNSQETPIYSKRRDALRAQLGQARGRGERRGDRLRGLHRRHRVLPGRPRASGRHLWHRPSRRSTSRSFATSPSASCSPTTSDNAGQSADVACL